jgi:hypothetical protein
MTEAEFGRGLRIIGCRGTGPLQQIEPAFGIALLATQYTVQPQCLGVLRLQLEKGRVSLPRCIEPAGAMQGHGFLQELAPFRLISRHHQCVAQFRDWPEDHRRSPACLAIRLKSRSVLSNISLCRTHSCASSASMVPIWMPAWRQVLRSPAAAI